MKRVISIFLFCLLLGPLAVQAQKNIIKVNPLSAFVLTGNVQYERAITRHISFQMGVFHGRFGLPVPSFQGGEARISYRSLGITPEVRFYLGGPNKRHMRGFFLAPYFRYRQFGLDIDVEYINDQNPELNVSEQHDGMLKLTGGGMLLGVQGIIGRVVSMEVFAGPQYAVRDLSLSGYEGDPLDLIPVLGSGGLGIRAGATIGIAF